MLNFEYKNPTKIIFGKNSLGKIGKEILKYGTKVLLVTGSGSVKRTGLYNSVIDELKSNLIQVFEVGGIQPNPRLTSVYEGIEICNKNNIDFILAVGGGSVIDAAKGMAAGAKTQIDIWEYYLRKHAIKTALPLGAVLTLAATGSEMNGNSVVTNWETNEKIPIGSEHLYPRFSVLDPEYTYSVPREHTVNGCVDIIVHVFEQYFSHTPNTPLQDRVCEAIIKTTIENTYKVLDNPRNYDARANIMWCGTMALNKLAGMGKAQDWGTHAIEHEISAIYDIAHGAGLAIICPAWMHHVLHEGAGIFKQYAERIWEVDTKDMSDEQAAIEGINRTKAFFKEIGAPVSLTEIGINDANIDLLAEKTVRFGPVGRYKKLYKQDVKEILKICL